VSGYGQFAKHYFAAGWAPLPLPHGQKWPPPSDTTGYGSPMPTQEQVEAWVAALPDSNVALRLPENVIGIDIDGYKDEAIATMTELTGRLGPLPATWRSSSRVDGRSGIYFYRIPDGLLHLGDVGKGVETIRHAHRYAVVAPSLHPEGGYYTWYAPNGTNKAPHVGDLPELPIEWVEHLVSRANNKVRERAAYDGAPTPAYDALPEDEKRRVDAYVQTTLDGIRADLTASASWGEGETDGRGRGWEKLQADKAIRLAALAQADWNTYSMQQAYDDFVAWAPTGGRWTPYEVTKKFESQAARANPQPMPAAPAPRIDLFQGSGAIPSFPNGTPAPGSAVGAATGSAMVPAGSREEIDVANPAKALEWLRENLGRGRLSGIFTRGSEVVFTPLVGEEGYIAPRSIRPNALRPLVTESASITPLDKDSLAARIQARYSPFTTKEVTDAAGETKRVRTPILFPTQATQFAVKAPDDLNGLRPLYGVVHTPTFRDDGSLLATPGYDDLTGVLFLPTGGQPEAAIPEYPDPAQVALAVSWIDFMLQDFSFVGPDDRANYIGLMLTPLLRRLVPAPYKLGVIEAHQPGSGKTYLARALMTIHSGIMHSEMPAEEAELIKTITSVLDTSTGAVCVFDNVSGIVRSSALAGLLTSPTFQGRRLGTGKLVDVLNERLWVITGNNAVLGGDLPRRSLRVRIDPGVPNPEARTKFAISDFERWVQRHRGDLLWSLIVLVRNWVQHGSPVPDEVRADSYGHWSAVVGSILRCAGVPGIFDDPLAAETNDPETDEWRQLFDRIYELHGTEVWSAKQIMGEVAPLGIESVTNVHTPPISYDLLPSALLAGKQVIAPTALARSFGIFLRNREGRWFGPYSVRRAPSTAGAKQQWWHIVRHDRSEE
jgi:hypothetical protein